MRIPLRLPLVLALQLATACSGDCDTRGDRLYSIEAGDGPGTVFQGAPVAWSGRTGFREPCVVRVYVPTDTAIPDFDLVELYDSTGARLPLSGVHLRDEWLPLDCFQDAVEYDISDLPRGEYTLVHRRSAAFPGMFVVEARWSTFEGEEALVTTLVRDEACVRRGG